MFNNPWRIPPCRSLSQQLPDQTPDLKGVRKPLHQYYSACESKDPYDPAALKEDLPWSRATQVEASLAVSQCGSAGQEGLPGHPWLGAWRQAWWTNVGEEVGGPSPWCLRSTCSLSTGC